MGLGTSDAPQKGLERARFTANRLGLSLFCRSVKTRGYPRTEDKGASSFQVLVFLQGKRTIRPKSMKRVEWVRF